MSRWEQEIRLLMLDGAQDLPRTMPCPVCLKHQLTAKFRPVFRQPNVKQKITGAWMLRRICASCNARRASGTLLLPETDRWEAVYAEVDELLRAEAERRLAERVALGQAIAPESPDPATAASRSRQGHRITEPGTSPYDIASAQLTQELGRPEEQWTRAENLECTRRIYRLLGWDEQDLMKGSAAERIAQAAKKGAEKRTKAYTDNDEEEA